MILSNTEKRSEKKWKAEKESKQVTRVLHMDRATA